MKATLTAKIREQESGAVTIDWSSKVKPTGEKLPAESVWRAWVVLAIDLLNDPDLPAGQRSLCQAVVEALGVGPGGGVPPATEQSH